MKKQGVLIYDDVIGRMDIRFGPLDYYGGLHCGERLEVLLDGEWIPTRIELGEFWYLKGVKLIKLKVLWVPGQSLPPELHFAKDTPPTVAIRTL